MREIATMLQLTESRICQIHAKVIKRLKDMHEHEARRTSSPRMPIRASASPPVRVVAALGAAGAGRRAEAGRRRVLGPPRAARAGRAAARMRRAAGGSAAR